MFEYSVPYKYGKSAFPGLPRPPDGGDFQSRQMDDCANLQQEVESQNAIYRKSIIHRADFYLEIANFEVGIKGERIYRFEKDYLRAAYASQLTDGVCWLRLEADGFHEFGRKDRSCAAGIYDNAVGDKALTAINECCRGKKQIVLKAQFHAMPRMPNQLRS